MEGGEHPLDLTPPLGRALHPQAGRQPRRDGALRGVDGGRVEEPDLDPVDPSEAVEAPLRGGDVEQREPAVRDPRRPLVEEQAAHRHLVRGVADDEPHRRADVDAVPPREPLGQDDRRRVEQHVEQLLRPRGPPLPREAQQLVLPERPLAQHVDPQHAEPVAGAVGGLEPGVAIDDGTDAPVLAQPPHAGELILGHADPRPDDLQRGLPGHHVERSLEAAHRGGVGEADGHHHRDPEGQPGDGDEAPHRIAPHAAHDELAEEGQSTGSGQLSTSASPSASNHPTRVRVSTEGSRAPRATHRPGTTRFRRPTGRARTARQLRPAPAR